MVDAVAVEVHDAPAADLLDPHAGSGLDGGAAGRGRGLMEEVAGVRLDQTAGSVRFWHSSPAHRADATTRGAGPDTGEASPGPLTALEPVWYQGA
jgi:hypothetical protein